MTERLPGETTDHVGVSAVLLAAGRASRMGKAGFHKLLAEFEGVPLVRKAALAALASRACPVTVVTGHRQAEIERALTGLDLLLVQNADYVLGMASSLASAMALPQNRDASGVIVLLADMPRILSMHIDAMIDRFCTERGEAVVRASCGGLPGNPVIIPRSLYPAVEALEGDGGARKLIEESGMPIIDVDIGEASQVDVDTADAVRSEGGFLRA